MHKPGWMKGGDQPLENGSGREPVRMEPISATIITFNEAENIKEALESVSWVDEIVVVDSGSSDATIDICRQFNARILRRDWTGFVGQKSFAVEKASHNWILSLDADERISPELRLEVQALRESGLKSPGYRIPRLAFFMGRWIRHGDWYPDYQLRLFDRRLSRWEGGRVHESVKTQGNPGLLKGEILHYTYRSLTDYLERLEIYSALAAADYRDHGKVSAGWKLIGNPFATFIKAYILKRGFKDGTPGLMVAAMGAISVFFKYAKLYELQHRRIGPSGH